MGMFGYKTVLQFGYGGGAVNTSYELVDFSYDVFQAIDEKGKPQSNMFLGSLRMIYPGLPTKELLEYMVNPNRQKDGEVKVIDNEGRTIQNISFEKGMCVKLDFSYDQAGSGYVSTSFVLVAKEITIDGQTVSNKWVNK